MSKGWALPDTGWLLATLLGLLAVTLYAIPGLDREAAQDAHRYVMTEDYNWSVAVTDAAGPLVVVLVLAVAVGGLVLRGRGTSALILATSAFSSELAVAVIKHLLQRQRPRFGAVVEASGYSLPSGHATLSVAIYGTIAIMAARATRGPTRVAILAAGLVLIAAIGVSRVLVGAHYPSDVVAGWGVGVACTTATWALLAAGTRRFARSRPVSDDR
ncbi:MAG: phosphatase PAP2 family protein [Acidimicrobiales bacterium]